MGVNKLNKFLNDTCDKQIKNITFDKLSGKKIVIDTSIYIYKFSINNALIEKFYNMIMLFKKYNIVPIFVFDGKPADNKKDILLQRKQNKIDAITELNKLELELKNTPNNTNRFNLLTKINKLKPQTIIITKDLINRLQLLFKYLDVLYINAINESDTLCSYLVIHKDIYGCLSEDTDMFVYGCTNVLKNLDLVNCTMDIYNINKILSNLKLNLNNFIDMCILAGTDYNSTANNIYTIYKIYINAIKKQNLNYNNINLIKLLQDNTDNIKIDYNKFINIKQIYNLENFKYINQNKLIKPDNKINISKLHQLLKKERFLFLQK